MKKIYFLTLTSLLSLSAFAQRQPMGPSSVANAPMHADKTMADFEAMDEWSYFSHVANQNQGMQTAITVTVDESTGQAAVKTSNFTLSATYDAEKGTLTIPTMQKVGEDADGDIIFYLKSLGSNFKIDAEPSDAPASVGIVDGSTVTFPTTEVWALGSPEQEDKGFYLLSSSNKFYKNTWKSIGMGKYLDNVLYPSLLDRTENTDWADVEILSDGQGSYKIVNPFQKLYAKKGLTDESPAMTLIATDSDNVLIPLSYSGLYSTEQGQYNYCSQSWYIDTFGGSPLAEDLRITKTVEGNEVTITIPYHAIYLCPTEAGSLYFGSLFASYVKFTDTSLAVENVRTESNAPSRFYNLQGMEINNPAPGTIVIRVQGSKVVKEIIH